MYAELSFFCNKYSPATAETATDFFSSKEIKYIIEEFTGEKIEVKKIHTALLEMQYEYVLKDDSFVWLCIQD